MLHMLACFRLAADANSLITSWHTISSPCMCPGHAVLCLQLHKTPDMSAMTRLTTWTTFPNDKKDEVLTKDLLLVFH